MTWPNIWYPIYDQNGGKWLKWIPYLWPKRLKNHTLWGRTYLYSPYKGVPPPRVPSTLIRHENGAFLRKRLSIRRNFKIPTSRFRVYGKDFLVRSDVCVFIPCHRIQESRCIFDGIQRNIPFVRCVSYSRPKKAVVFSLYFRWHGMK